MEWNSSFLSCPAPSSSVPHLNDAVIIHLGPQIRNLGANRDSSTFPNPTFSESKQVNSTFQLSLCFVPALSLLSGNYLHLGPLSSLLQLPSVLSESPEKQIPKQGFGYGLFIWKVILARALREGGCEIGEMRRDNKKWLSGSPQRTTGVQSTVIPPPQPLRDFGEHA